MRVKVFRAEEAAIKAAGKMHAKAAAKSTTRNWTDEERLDDEFSKVSDQLERARDNIQDQHNDSRTKRSQELQIAEQKYHSWLRSNRRNIEKFWGADWYRQNLPPGLEASGHSG